MKSIPLFLLFLIFTLFISGAAYGDSTAGSVSGQELPDPAREIISRLQLESKDAFGFRPGYIMTKKGAGDDNELPVSFDLRNVDTDNDGEPDTSYVTPVKLQYPFGTCWGFAAIGAAETSLLSSGIAGELGLAAAADPEKGLKELDLSEKHVAYFVNRPIMKEGDPQYGEGYYIPDIEEGSSDIYQTGGATFLATSVFASGTGPVLESENEQFEYHGREKITEREHKYEQDVNDPFDYYSPADDWTIDEDLRWSQNFILSESNILPSPGLLIDIPEQNAGTPEGGTGMSKEGTDTSAEWEAANDAIKEQLLQGHAVAISILADHSNPNDENPPHYINLENWAHYVFDSHYADHEVLIVGWDDRYPKENFAHEAEIDGEIITSPNPKHDGAWLVKNSWGSKENDFPTRSRIGEWGLLNGQDKYPFEAKPGAKMTGYFWISYEDASLQRPETVTFDYNLAADEFWIGQYDYMPVSQVNAIWDVDPEKVFKMANIFTAEEDSRLESVSCQTLFTGTKVLYEVYRLNDPSAGPEQGEPAAQVSIEYPWGGFHKEKLDAPLVFRKGEHFSVVVTQQTSDGFYPFSMQLDINEKYHSDFPSLYYAKAIVNPGESWLYMADNWLDFSDIIDDLLAEAGGEWAPYYSIDNFPIKAWLGKLEPEYTAPQAKQLMYTGDPLPLVEPGVMISEGTMYYTLGSAEGSTEEFSTSVPAAAEPGTYYVWYYIDGENVRKSTKPQCIAVTITGSSRELENLFTTIDLMDANIAFLQAEMTAGHVTSAALTQMYIDRINAYDKKLDLNSIIGINPSAVRDAEALDQERRSGHVRGPLHGIPIVVKANISVAGMSVNAGSSVLAGMTAQNDAFVIQKLKEAGAVILAQANMSEFALSAVSSRSSLGGIVHNAYDVRKTPMGSSGGTAVAVTSNFAAAGLGTDTGGSIRNPSSVANLYGLRPTKGLTSVSGVIPLAKFRDTVGPMARTAEDMALMLEIMAGTDAGDDYTLEADADALARDGYTKNLSAGALKGMRIAFLDQSFSYTYEEEEDNTAGRNFENKNFAVPPEPNNLGPSEDLIRRLVSHADGTAGKNIVTVKPDPKIQAMLDRTLQTLKEAGAEIVDLSGKISEQLLEAIYNHTDNGTTEYDINLFFHEMGTAAPYQTLKAMYRANQGLEYLNNFVYSLCPYMDPDKCEPETYLADSWETTTNPYTVSFGPYKRGSAWEDVLLFRGEISRILKMNNIDAVMYLKFGNAAPDQDPFDPRALIMISAYDFIFGSALGFPDISLPMGFPEDNAKDPSELPLGLSIFSDFGNDEKLMRIAYAYEQQAGKSIRRTPELTPALEDPALNAFLQDLIDKAGSIDYSLYDWTPVQQVQQMMNARAAAQNVDTSDPYAVYAAAAALAQAYDDVMASLINGRTDPGRPGILEFFLLEDELPATGITGGSAVPLSGKPAALNYRPLGMELQIPTLGLSSEIVTVTPENGKYPIDWLGEQTGWLEGSARPGEGNSVLAAHNTLNAEEFGPFALISTMREGDRFSLLGKDGRLMMFEVYANQKIGAGDRKALEETAAAFENTLTLLTCEDERVEGGYASRRIVAARKLD